MPNATDAEILSEAESLFDSPESIIDDADDTLGDEPEVASEVPSTADKIDDVLTAQPEKVAKVDAPDEWASAKPLSYLTDGQTKAFDGIKIIADEKGNPTKVQLDIAALPEIAKRFSRHDHMEGANSSLYGKVQSYERMEFTGGDKTVHKGMAAFEQSVTENAKLSAAARIFANVIEDPDKVIAIANAHISGDPAELQRLLRDVKQEVRDAEWNARQSFVKRAADSTQQQETATQREQVTQSSISQSINHWAGQFPALTKEDTDAALAYLTKVGTAIVRVASPEEARTAGVQPGSLIVDHPVVYEYLKGRAEVRTAALQSAEASNKAAEENRLKIAAAQRTRAKQQGERRTSSNSPPAKKDEGPTWGEIKRAANKGQFLTSVVGEADD